MKQSPLRFWNLLLGGLVLISLGFAFSSGLNAVQALAPMIGVVGGLTVLSSMAAGGPRAFM